MALTIQQIQDNITNKQDAREIINQIADYIQANPGGGGSSYLVYDSVGDFPTTGETDTAYLALDSGGVYQWNGSAYIFVGLSILQNNDNYFEVGKNGSGIYMDAGMKDGGQTMTLALFPVSQRQTFSELGFNSVFYKEAARFDYLIQSEDETIKSKISIDLDAQEFRFLDVSNSVTWGIKIDRTNGIIKITKNGSTKNLVGIDVADDFADDAAAAAGGIPIGGLYHTSGAVKIRRS